MDILSLGDVRMCAEAPEIQSLMDKPVGLSFNHLRTGWDKYGRIWFKQSINHLIWIPYQEDLQIIAGHKSPREFERIDFAGNYYSNSQGMRVLLNRFDNFVSILQLNEGIQMSPRLGQYDTIRQLWLAFAMQEEYSKEWNGETWVSTKIKQGVV
ncbi:hypothetical protein CMI37_31840 [Candidatus Pacearchaeota archaeon]|nr:hypothetical protein [Candidatus Pacearchaeota archaeon]|tara:strand:- start:342 stop:803 length:462 start_codon:yes stop_codon:yes gene_type:complete